jgi:uncharacterized protein (DUF58 family)
VTPEEFLKRVKAIDLSVRRLIQEGLAGQYLSAFRGSGMQFREFRNYVYGDDVRHISWSASAKTIDPVLKTFEEERERHFLLVVDTSASLRKGAWAQQKAVRLAEIAASLALSAAEANDKIGLILFTDKVEKTIHPSKGKTHVMRVIRDVLGYEPESEGTDPNAALRHIEKVLKKQSIVFFLTDMEVLPEERLLRRCAAKHEFIVVGVEHTQEWKVPNVGFLEVQTAEAGRPVTLDTQSETLRRYLESHGQTRRLAIQQTFKKMGVDLVWINTEDNFATALQNFFKMRIARGRRN